MSPQSSKNWTYYVHGLQRQTGQVSLDVVDVQQWMSESLSDKPGKTDLAKDRPATSDAEVIFAILQQSAGHFHGVNPGVADAQGGRLEAIVRDLETNKGNAFPFIRHTGEELTEFHSDFPISGVGIPLSLLIWIVGLWFLSRRRRAIPQS